MERYQWLSGTIKLMFPYSFYTEVVYLKTYQSVVASCMAMGSERYISLWNGVFRITLVFFN